MNSDLARDEELQRQPPNTARYFVENAHVAWVLLVATLAWGVWGYNRMPQRKDPEIPVRVAVAIAAWPGAGSEAIEQLVTRKLEEKLAENSKIDRIESVTRMGVGVVQVRLDPAVADPAREFDDLKLRLDSIRDFPEGVRPVVFLKDFGDTAALMLTVASPRLGRVEVALRARAIRAAIESLRAEAGTVGPDTAPRVSIVSLYPPSVGAALVRRPFEAFTREAIASGLLREARIREGAGFVLLDGCSDRTDLQLTEAVGEFVRRRLAAAELHPDTWPPVVVRDPAGTEPALANAAIDRYSYRELDDFTDLIQRTLLTVPEVSKVTRSGVLREEVRLEYSQERLAASGLRLARLAEVLAGRNITVPGGVLEIDGRSVQIDPSGDFQSEAELGDVPIGSTPAGVLTYLRDVVDVVRGYESPARLLNHHLYRDAEGGWRRGRAITLAVQMRSGRQIGDFARSVDMALAGVRQRLPEDLVLERVSDQPRQVRENVGLFMTSLYEAIALVVLIALIGFWEWRSAALMAASIPLTLALTFGMMHLLGLDLQQVSIASLIIALGLLVDDPVVASDAIKRSLAAGHAPATAAWLGPTRLAKAILYATITNIVAYLPFLILSGDKGRFLYSLPIVLAASLVASRIVSMTFVPFLGRFLLVPEPGGVEAPQGRGRFAKAYRRAGSWAIRRRWLVLAGSLVFLAAGGVLLAMLKPQFFPTDHSYLSYVDVWLPENATLSATDQVARRAETVLRRVAGELGEAEPGADGRPRQVLRSVTTFVGGGGPRFWFSVAPEQQRPNYAQLVVLVEDKHDTRRLVGPWQRALSAEVPGARLDVRQLETGTPVGIPVSIRLSGDNLAALRRLAERVKGIFESTPGAERVRDNWGPESFGVRLGIDADRARLAGLSNLDVAVSSAAAISGYQVSTLREGNKQVPVVVRLRMDERAQLADVRNLYVYSLTGPQRLPLGQVSSFEYRSRTEVIQRRNHFRTVTVSCFPANGLLPSDIMRASRERLEEVLASLPPGYRMEVGGEEEEQVKGFKELALVMALSVAAIFLALVFQFRNAVKPFIVFAAIPYGVVGALAALAVMGVPFGFMAFLGVASLVGVIVSHVIVLFDFIEERHEQGAPLEEALLEAGIVRLRPVLVTVGATVFGLVPLAAHGGPLWEPMCYAQIGGLSVATFVTLGLVPVLYAVAVLDLKLVRWTTLVEKPRSESP